MTKTSTIVFVCEHGAAKSVIAAAYFNKLANKKVLKLQAIARGTHPDDELASKALAGLLEDGLRPTEPAPQKLLPADTESAQKVIAFCELPDGEYQMVEIERWDGVPPVSENYQTARDAILENLDQLITDLQPSNMQPPCPASLTNPT